MTIDDIKAGIADFPQLVKSVQSLKGEPDEALAKQYDPELHDVFDTTKRPDKLYTDENGSQVVSTVARLVVPLQKQITGRAATFLCGNPIALVSTPEDDPQKRLLHAVQKTWDDNKLDYKSKRLAKLMMSETDAAELWYVEPLAEDDPLYWDQILGNGAKYKLRMRVLAASLGDSLYPVYAPTGDMIAFGRGYFIGKEEHFDLYTADTTYAGIKPDGGNWTQTPTANTYKKIPVIYYSQPQAEWADVQTMIDRLEKLISNFADTNDYFGSPMLVASGTIKSFSKKGESGKMVELEPGADLKYLTWSQAPESIKLEIENLIKLIYSCTDTPNISFEEMKSLGAYSGIALKMLFLGAHMKASDKEEIFGESIQRRINYIKSVIGIIDVQMAKVQLSIKPKFEYFLPKNDAEKIDMLVNAVQGKILSAESGVVLNPLVEDGDVETARIKEEQSGAGLDNLMNG